MLRESLCWSCTKAYAKPEPYGCGFHRNGEKVYQDALITKAKKNTTSNFGNTEEEETEAILLDIVRVVKCEHYNISKRAVKESFRKYNNKIIKYLEEYSLNNTLRKEGIANKMSVENERQERQLVSV